MGIAGAAIGSAGIVTGIVLYRKKRLRKQQEKENEEVVEIENNIESQKNIAQKAL